jgi:AcrR family transcriptional regulator
MELNRRATLTRGRPREFDVEKALDRALKVFWRKGYEGTSLADLTAAMGINRPSLYAAFGNKESLFRKALDRYAEGPAAFVREALAAPTSRGVVERLLRGAVEAQTDSRNPRGCLLVNGALSCGDEAEPIRRELVARRKKADDALRARFERAVAEGDLPADADAGDLARYVVTVVRGMAVQAASGATREELQRVADMVLRNWPGK